MAISKIERSLTVIRMNICPFVCWSVTSTLVKSGFFCRRLCLIFCPVYRCLISILEVVWGFHCGCCRIELGLIKLFLGCSFHPFLSWLYTHNIFPPLHTSLTFRCNWTHKRLKYNFCHTILPLNYFRNEMYVDNVCVYIHGIMHTCMYCILACLSVRIIPNNVCFFA